MFIFKKIQRNDTKILSQVRERWNTSDKWHPAVLPNISGQVPRTAQAAEHHSGVKAEKPLYSTK